MSPPQKEQIDWSVCTFEGASLESLRRAAKLTFVERLEAVEELVRFAEAVHAERRRRGLPCVEDPRLIPPAWARRDEPPDAPVAPSGAAGG